MQDSKQTKYFCYYIITIKLGLRWGWGGTCFGGYEGMILDSDGEIHVVTKTTKKGEGDFITITHGKTYVGDLIQHGLALIMVQSPSSVLK